MESHDNFDKMEDMDNNLNMEEKATCEKEMSVKSISEGDGSVKDEEDWKLEADGGKREFAMREWGSQGRWGKITIEGGEWDLRSGREWGDGLASLNGRSSGRGGKKRRRKLMMCCCGDMGLVGLLIGVGTLFNITLIIIGRFYVVPT